MRPGGRSPAILEPSRRRLRNFYTVAVERRLKSRYDRFILAAPRLRMPLIELPRALDQYFAFAEIEPTRRGRRFSITLPFRSGDRVERLQWWYHVSPAQEQMFELMNKFAGQKT